MKNRWRRQVRIGVDTSELFYRHFERKIVGAGEARAIEYGALDDGGKEVGEQRGGVVLKFPMTFPYVIRHTAAARLKFRSAFVGRDSRWTLS